MTNTPPSTPSLKTSSGSMHSIQFDSATFYEGMPLTPPRRQSMERERSMSSPGGVRVDSIGGANTKLAKFNLRGRDSTKEFDFTFARTASRRLDLQGGVMSLVKGCLGAGIVAIHESYMVCGLWTALPINAALGFLLAYSMYELTRSAHKMYVRLDVPTLSYPELAQAALETGPWEKLHSYNKTFRHTVETFICINTLGACTVYQTMIARQLKQLVDGTEGLYNTWPTVRVYIAGLLVPCLIVSAFTSLKHLAPFSIILDVFIVLLAITTIWYAAIAATTSPLKMPTYRSLDGLFELIGVSMFSMDGIVITLAVENSLQNPKIFPLVLVIGMSIVIVLVMLIGSFGYWGYGDNSLAPITINFPWGAFSIQLKMFLVIMTYMTFALNFWTPSCLIWYYAANYHNPDNYWIWERVYRMLLVIITNIGALAAPSIAVFIGLLGSFCVSVLTFIFPAIITLSMDWVHPGPGKYYWRVWKALFFILLGLILCCIGTYANVREMVIFLTDPRNHGGIRNY